MNKNINKFDKVLKLVAPRYALKRTIARKSIDIINSGYGNYGANTTKKSLRGWMYYGGSSKEDIEDNVNILRQRSRDAYMGIPTASAALKTLRTNVIAGGLLPAPQIDSEFLKLSAEETEKLQADILREFYLWADTSTCDADGIDNFYKLQKLAYLSQLMNGDVLILLQTKKQINQPYQLNLRVVEADRVCSPNGMDILVPSIVNGHKVHRIVQGIETDADGVAIAYWVCNQHPLSNDVYSKELKWERVETIGEKTGRRNALLIMDRERAGQLRGVPILAPVLEAIKQLGRYTDAEITAAVLSSMFTVFVKSASPNNIAPFGEMLSPEEQIDALDQNTIELAPGAILSLNPGEEVQFADPKHPNTGYDVFTNALIKQIGAALEIPPEVMFKQFTTSFSAARGALNEFWRTCTMHRDSFVDMFCQPIYEEWFSEAVARGRINAPGYFSDPVVKKAYTGCMWNGPARTNLNPVQEVNAAIQRVNAGFSTAQDETAQMTGGDYNRNIKLRRMEALRKREVDMITEGEINAE
ncbi:MAG: phage portal protein [Eubacteriales bacterium]|nr:phage portal protein [Eubacteriales bacterium]